MPQVHAHPPVRPNRDHLGPGLPPRQEVGVVPDGAAEDHGRVLLLLLLFLLHIPPLRRRRHRGRIPRRTRRVRLAAPPVLLLVLAQPPPATHLLDPPVPLLSHRWPGPLMPLPLPPLLPLLALLPRAEAQEVHHLADGGRGARAREEQHVFGLGALVVVKWGGRVDV